MFCKELVKEYKIEDKLPPLKKPPSTNSFTPSSSKPIPAKTILFASNCGLISLSSLDHSRQNGHPNLRRNTTTAVAFCQILLIGTIYGIKQTSLPTAWHAELYGYLERQFLFTIHEC